MVLASAYQVERGVGMWMFFELADIVDAAAFLYLQAHSLVARGTCLGTILVTKTSQKSNMWLLLGASGFPCANKHHATWNGAGVCCCSRLAAHRSDSKSVPLSYESCIFSRQFTAWGFGFLYVLVSPLVWAVSVSSGLSCRKPLSLVLPPSWFGKMCSAALLGLVQALPKNITVKKTILSLVYSLQKGEKPKKRCKFHFPFLQLFGVYCGIIS